VKVLIVLVVVLVIGFFIPPEFRRREHCPRPEKKGIDYEDDDEDEDD